MFAVTRLLILAGIILSGQPDAVRGVETLYRFLFNAPDPAGSLAAFHPLFLHTHAHSFNDLAKYWDGFWYYKMATQGYVFDGTVVHQTIAHYPFFTLLILAVSVFPIVFGFPPDSALLWSGVLLNNVLFYLSLCMVHHLMSKLGHPKAAFPAVMLLALYPGSFYCSMFLTESAYLALSLAFFCALEHNRYWLAAFLSWPVILTRYNGAILPLPFLEKLGFRNLFRRKTLLLLSFITLGVALYPLYLYVRFGDPLLYVKMQTLYRGEASMLKLGICLILFGAAFALPYVRRALQARLPGYYRLLRTMAVTVLLSGMFLFYTNSARALSGYHPVANQFQHIIPGYEITGFAGTMFAVIVFGLFCTRLPLRYGMFTGLHLFPILYGSTFICNQRYVVMIFPIFWLLALGLQNRPVLRTAFYGVFGVLLLMLSVLYVSMEWLFMF